MAFIAYDPSIFKNNMRLAEIDSRIVFVLSLDGIDGGGANECPLTVAIGPSLRYTLEPKIISVPTML